MKKVLMALAITFTLVGCSSNSSPTGTISNAVVKDKHAEGGRFRTYYVQLEKNNQDIELKANSENDFNALQTGTVVTVTYNKDYYITGIKFPKLQDK